MSPKTEISLNICSQSSRFQSPPGAPSMAPMPQLRSQQRLAIQSWCAHRTCLADGRWRSSTARTSSGRTCAMPPRLPEGAPILIDRYIIGKEAEVDVIADGKRRVSPPGHHGARRARGGP